MIIEHDSAGWALDDINDLLAAELIDVELAHRGRDAVGLLFNRDTVFASISEVDEGDLSFYWVAGTRMISIILIAEKNEELDYMGVWYGYNDSEGERIFGVSPGVPKQLYDVLAEFSAEVQKINPEWPKLSRRYEKWAKRQDALAVLGDLVDNASWRTPKYSLYGLDYTEEQKAHYYRQNDIAVGRSLVDSLAEHQELKELLGGQV